MGEYIISWELLTVKRQEELAYGGITSVPILDMSLETLGPAMPEIPALLDHGTKKFTLLLKKISTELLSLII